MCRNLDHIDTPHMCTTLDAQLLWPFLIANEHAALRPHVTPKVSGVIKNRNPHGIVDLGCKLHI